MKQHIKILYLAVAALCWLTATPASAQMLERNDMVYNTFNMPQANLLNPAFMPQNRNVYVSLPYNQVSIGLPLSYNDLQWKYNEADQRYDLDLMSLSQTLADNRRLHLSASSDLLGFGMRLNDIFFINFNIGLRGDFALNYDEKINDVLQDGFIDNVGAANKAIIAADELTHFQAFERYSIGFGCQLEKFSAGLHVNLLNGIFNAYTDETYITLYAEDDAFSALHGELHYRLMRAGSLNFNINEGNFDINGTSNNFGISFDLGFAYNFGPLQVSASIIDFGPGIRWGKNVMYSEAQNKEFVFSGADLNNFFSNGKYNSNYTNTLSDTLANIIAVCENEGEAYWYGVPTKIYLGAAYTFNQTFRVNMLFHGEWDNGVFYATDGHFRSNLCLSGSISAGKWFNLLLSNALAFDGKSGSIFNPGFGIVLTPGNTVQLFGMMDYMSSFYAADIKGVNFQFGLNLFFGAEPEQKTAFKNKTKTDAYFSPLVF